VEEFCVAEFGALHGTGTMAAQLLIADSLDLRHRLPMLWRQVLGGDVRAWQARKVAEATRPLSEEACAELDAQLSGMICMLPWSRFSRILCAAVLDADPALAAERERRARELRNVWATDSEDGLKTIIARAASGDAVWFMATINRIAGILATDGDTDPVGVRRSKAIGILAQPAEALRLLAAHRNDPADDTEPASALDLDEDPNDGLDLDVQNDPTTSPAYADSDPNQTSLNIDPQTTAQLRAGRPKVVLVYHLADAAIRRGHGVARPEHGEAATLSELREWLADTKCSITVRPVVDPAEGASIDAYEVPQWMRDAVRLRNLADVFPYGSATTATMDLDHTVPWIPPDRGGPRGQTRPGNLGPYTRAHHRLLTHGHWQRRQPEPGTYLYRTPVGQIYLVTNQGTHRLGTTDFAQAVWHACTHASTEEEAC
jgi:hypothetical protein